MSISVLIAFLAFIDLLLRLCSNYDNQLRPNDAFRKIGKIHAVRRMPALLLKADH